MIKSGQEQLTKERLLEQVQDETYWKAKATADRIERYKKAELDSDRKERLKQHLCKYCYYLQGSVLAGQAFTSATCVSCGVEMTFSSTHTDKICTDCAKNHKLCRHCLSDIDFKKRRKL